MSIRSAVRNAVTQLSPEQGKQSDSEVAYKGDDTLPGILATLGKSYAYVEEQLRLSRDRRINNQLYDQMDDEYPEVAAALDLYADNVTQVDLSASEGSRGRAHVLNILSDDVKLRDFCNELRERLDLDSRVWASARSLAKYGELFEEVVVTEDLRVARLKELDQNSMLRNEDKYGRLPRNKAFVQLRDGEEVVAQFDDWEIMHARLMRRNRDLYGSSILHSVRRTYKQLRMIEDAMVVARLTRATSKLVYFIDTGNLPPKLAEKHVDDVRNRFKKRRIFDQRTQNMREDYNPMTAEEDIFMATRQGSNVDVKQLYGDINIGNIDDVQHFQTKLISGLKTPKSYMQILQDTSGKAELTQQDIQFARVVRRLQMALRQSYVRLFQTALILEWPKATLELLSNFTITLPGLKSIDELREWEMRRIQSEVARIWTHELFIEPQAVMRLILGFSEAEANKLYQGLNHDVHKAVLDVNRAKAFKSAEDKKFSQKVREALGDERILALRELCEMSLEQKAIEEQIDKQNGDA